MNRIRWLVKLYPKAWRERYEDEFLAMLEQRRVTLFDTLNILSGIMDAHLHDVTLTNPSGIERVKYMLNKLRGTYSKGLIAFLFFIVPCFLFNAMLDDSPFLPVMRNTPSFIFAYRGFIAGVSLVLLSLFVGGCFVLFDVFKWAALQKRKDVLALLFVPLLTFIVFAFIVYYLNFSMESTLPGWMRGGIDQSMVCLLLLIGGTCLYRILKKGQIEVHPKESKNSPYSLGMFAAPVAAIGMAISSISVIIWGFMANSFASNDLFSSRLGIFQLSTLPFYLCLVLIMLVSTSASGIVAFRGIRYVTK